jgi:hypothetical protein
VAELFDRWVRLVEDAPCDKVHEKFVEEARAAGLLKARPRPAPCPPAARPPVRQLRRLIQQPMSGVRLLGSHPA